MLFSRNLPLPTFDVESVNKEFCTSVHELKSINRPLWCLKCIGKSHYYYYHHQSIKYKMPICLV